MKQEAEEKEGGTTTNTYERKRFFQETVWETSQLSAFSPARW